ncbi:MAG: hypothetical protein AAGK97_02720, partial [Bacteroidota bacterium]
MSKNLVFIYFALFVLFCSSCQKDIVEPQNAAQPIEENEGDLLVKKKFFDLNYLTDHNPYLKRPSYQRGNPAEIVDAIYADILSDNADHDFVPNLVSQFGLPAWNNVAIMDADDSDDKLVVIPFVHPTDDFISGYLSAIYNEQDIHYKFISKERVDYYVETGDLGVDKDLAMNELMLFYKAQNMAFLLGGFEYWDFIYNNVELNENDRIVKIQGQLSSFPRTSYVTLEVCIRHEVARAPVYVYHYTRFKVICTPEYEPGSFNDDWWSEFPPRGGGNTPNNNYNNSSTASQEFLDMLDDCSSNDISLGDPFCYNYNRLVT